MMVLIAVPSLDHCPTDFAMSLAALMQHRPHSVRLGKRTPVEVALMNCKGSLIMHSRNILMKAALDAAATHIFFLDSDMVVPPNTLDRLIHHHVPIVGADYVRRVPPHTLIANPDASHTHRTSALWPMLTLPFGCVLIDLKVVVDMPRPWFKYLEGESEATTQSEDTYFCNAARRLGHTIWCDVQLTREVGHIGIKVFRPS
jgi:hypothetical protein